MINFEDVIIEETKERNQNLPEIPNHSYIILIVGGSGSGQTKSFFNPINLKLDIDKIYLHTKDAYEAK